MTLIQISDELWSYLNSLKHPGDTFEDVLKKLLKDYKENKK